MWYNIVKHIKALSIMERSITMSEKDGIIKSYSPHRREPEKRREICLQIYRYLWETAVCLFLEVSAYGQNPGRKARRYSVEGKEKKSKKTLTTVSTISERKWRSVNSTQSRYATGQMCGMVQSRGEKQLMRILQEDKLGACRIENVSSLTQRNGRYAWKKKVTASRLSTTTSVP